MDFAEYQDLYLRSWPLLLKGAKMTLMVLSLASCLSLALGVTFGVISSNRLKIFVVSKLIESITFILRAVPFYVQLLIIYFVLPDLLGINLDAFIASILALGLCSSGYVAQIMRGSINNLPDDQWESAIALGYSRWQILRYVVLPQAFRIALPPLTNECDALLKSTAILSSIGMLEITRVGMNIISREMQPLAIYLFIALFYVGISLIFNLISKRLERRYRFVC